MGESDHFPAGVALMENQTTGAVIYKPYSIYIFRAEDVVGCCLTCDNEVYFTKNGMYFP